MINIVSPINQLGYGITGLNIVKSLCKENIKVSLFCLGQPQITNQNDATIIQNCINNGQFLDFKAPCIKIWHQHDMTQFAGSGLRVGFPIFELDIFTDLEKHHLNSLDKILVCSNWAKQIILNNINIDTNNVIVIPLGVDLDIFKPTSMSDCGTTRFFTCGKWEVRKGHDMLADIFNEAFDENDDVELWMMCDNPFCTQEEILTWKNKYLNSKLGHKITIIPRKTTQEEVYNIMAKTHCGLFISRAEGWNLELLEMMACGKPVIATNYSAHTEFCTQENAHLIEINESEPAYDGKWFHKQGNWAKLGSKQKSSIIEHMRSIHSMRLNNNLAINNNGLLTAQHFTWSNSAKEIIKHIL